MFIVFLFICIGFAYFFLLMHFTSGWRHLPEEELLDKPSDFFISVIVPFKNEEKNLPQLLQNLILQSHKNFEIILIDDHSSDNSLMSIECLRSQFIQITTITAQGNGKKNALKEGISKAKGKLIVCTDADCQPLENWLKSIAQYQEREACDLIICPVKMIVGNTLFSKLQALEFASLIATGAGAAASNMPILCNGANLAFTPKVWQESIGGLKEKEDSGDDMFLLMSIKKRGGKIRFLKSTAAMVETTSCETLTNFFNQRKRWASKSKSYTDWQVIGVALLVFLVCMVMLGSLAAGFFDPIFWKVALFLYGLKLLADVSLLMPSAKFFSIEKLLFYIPFLEIIYPFYVVIAVVGGLLGRFRWK